MVAAAPLRAEAKIRYKQHATGAPPIVTRRAQSTLACGSLASKRQQHRPLRAARPGAAAAAPSSSLTRSPHFLLPPVPLFLACCFPAPPPPPPPPTDAPAAPGAASSPAQIPSIRAPKAARENRARTCP